MGRRVPRPRCCFRLLCVLIVAVLCLVCFGGRAWPFEAVKNFEKHAVNEFAEWAAARQYSGGSGGSGGCISWRQTGGCDPVSGEREPENDVGCDGVVQSGWSGYCECSRPRPHSDGQPLDQIRIRMALCDCDHRPLLCSVECTGQMTTPAHVANAFAERYDASHLRAPVCSFGRARGLLSSG